MNSLARQYPVPTPALVAVAALGGAVVAALGMALQGGWTADGAAAAARLTARFSFVWFVAAFSASALNKLWPGGWRSVLLRRRRAIGLSFAAAHMVHLAALLTAILIFDRPSSIVTAVGGGLTYVFIVLMALTSNDQSVRTLGPRNWKLLHTVGAYAIAGVFFVSYLGRLDGKPWLAIPALTLLGLAMLLRVSAAFRARPA